MFIMAALTHFSTVLLFGKSFIVLRSSYLCEKSAVFAKVCASSTGVTRTKPCHSFISESRVYIAGAGGETPIKRKLSNSSLDILHFWKSSSVNGNLRCVRQSVRAEKAAHCQFPSISSVWGWHLRPTRALRKQTSFHFDLWDSKRYWTRWSQYTLGSKWCEFV